METREQPAASPPTVEGYLRIPAARWAANRLFMRAEGYEGLRRRSPHGPSNSFLMEKKARKLDDGRSEALKKMKGESYEEKMTNYIDEGVKTGTIAEGEAEILKRHVNGQIDDDETKQSPEEKVFLGKFRSVMQSLETY